MTGTRYGALDACFSGGAKCYLGVLIEKSNEVLSDCYFSRDMVIYFRAFFEDLNDIEERISLRSTIRALQCFKKLYSIQLMTAKND